MPEIRVCFKVPEAPERLDEAIKKISPCSEETLFCVSSALVCDGVNHCPSGDEYFSDEDAVMCARHKAITATNVSKTKKKHLSNRSNEF